MADVTPPWQAAAAAEMQQCMLALAQLFVDCWPTYLDGLEGMVRQCVARGWSEQQARALAASLVVAIATGQQPPAQDGM